MEQVRVGVERDTPTSVHAVRLVKFGAAQTRGLDTVARINALIVYSGAVITLQEHLFGECRVLRISPGMRPDRVLCLCLNHATGYTFSVGRPWDYKFGIYLGANSAEAEDD